MYDTLTNSQYTLYNVLCNVITVNCYCVSISYQLANQQKNILYIYCVFPIVCGEPATAKLFR